MLWRMAKWIACMSRLTFDPAVDLSRGLTAFDPARYL